MKRAIVVLSLCGALPITLPHVSVPLSGTLCAQDLLPEVSARRQAAIDRARKRVSEAMQASRRASDARAREILSAARAELRRDMDLPDSVLGDLDRSITRELDILGQASDAPPILPAPNPGAGPKPGALLPPPNRDRAQMDERVVPKVPLSPSFPRFSPVFHCWWGELVPRRLCLAPKPKSLLP